MPTDALCTGPLATRPFFQVPGPNPILVRGGAGGWDGECLETGDILRDYLAGPESYHLYYHACAADRDRWPGGYRIGAATAAHPLGPFEKAPGNPLLDLAPAGSWDSYCVACPAVLKQERDEYLMWYSGTDAPGDHGKWGIGLATASHPLGPWTRYERNPILRDFGYVGGVVCVEGTYFLYTEHPISVAALDYGPLALATASQPHGPWVPYAGNPVLATSSWGAWDDGGYSEAKVTHRDGVFHLFYGGVKQHAVRRRSLESIGYAFSLDGYRFTRHLANPVARREASPDASAFGEVKALIEPPFVYLYHTLRYLSTPEDDLEVEDLGVQVLAMETPFRFSMPLLQTKTLAPASATGADACPSVALDRISELAVTVRCAYAPDAGAGLRLHVRTSPDGRQWDNEDYACFDIPCRPGRTVNRTEKIPSGPLFARVMVENLCSTAAVPEVAVAATLGSG